MFLSHTLFGFSLPEGGREGAGGHGAGGDVAEVNGDGRLLGRDLQLNKQLNYVEKLPATIDKKPSQIPTVCPGSSYPFYIVNYYIL
mgnify:CR=1 FL=1